MAGAAASATAALPGNGALSGFLPAMADLLIMQYKGP